MIGGGIGVTPYASILSDLVYGTSTNRYRGVTCRKVYFLWICPTHRSWEWFVDVLRSVEERDIMDVIDVHIFITQYFDNFDLRTMLLYICEKHFQSFFKRSIFTGLKAKNHFGRPQFAEIFKFVRAKHPRVNRVGVFSCGPPALTNSIGSACAEVNTTRQLPNFMHFYENF
ncbi:PREDICTED: dual oxidase-like [Priapulus caudatus]|uniref:Dual oxidase-like n=1 Tax=Priapulus caudatus TaxID=37621 RepID=A0ABM1DWH2_PRICU|nr:PREDICTED: dual oxidase-like [Priapulus caudatus]